MDIQALEKQARQVRRDIITMVSKAGAGHPGGSLDMAEIMAVLYFDVMNFDFNDPQKEDRDYFVLSKGHGAIEQSLQAALCILRFCVILFGQCFTFAGYCCLIDDLTLSDQGSTYLFKQLIDVCRIDLQCFGLKDFPAVRTGLNFHFVENFAHHPVLKFIL